MTGGTIGATLVVALLVAVCSAGSVLPPLAVGNLNADLVKMEYAVRGRLVTRALELKSQLASDPSSLPFDSLIWCNIGNPQSLGQQPISFFRQVLALMEYPALMDNEAAKGAFAADAVSRAQELLSATGGTGAYTYSKGFAYVRESVAKFIEDRDGFPADPDNIFLTNGASPAIQSVIAHLIRDHDDGIMIPIPQYPLYSASIVGSGGTLVGYALDEANGWSLQISALEAALAKAEEGGVTVRAIVVINPGNPTGQTLSLANMQEVVAFCVDHGLVLLADEVYQSNVYYPSQYPFHSFKKAQAQAAASGAIAPGSLQLFSFHTISKGMVGECGHRGGYMEAVGVAPQVIDQLYKAASIQLCANTVGQILVELMVNPPKPGDASYASYTSEVSAVYESLKRRSVRLADALAALPGVTVAPSSGAMYAFPKFELPAAAVAAAAAQGIAPDVMYCLELVEATGVVVVPGSGFKGGDEGPPFHFRTTFLPSEEQIGSVIEKVSAFHLDFLRKYGHGHDDL